MSVVQEQRLIVRGVPVDPALRTVALGTLVNRAGTGLVMTTLALYYTRDVGLRPAEVALALSLAGLASMAVNVPAGQLGDALGPVRVMRAALLFSGVAATGFLVAREFWSLAVVVCLTNAGANAASSVRNGYIAQIATGARGVEFKAYLRAVTNVAISFGAALGGLALAVDETWAYLTAFGVQAAGTITTAVLSWHLPEIPAVARRDGEPRLAVLRDHPYVVVTVLNSVFAMHFVVMDVGLALWISEHTDAPRTMVAVLLIVNTICVALFQVRLARRTIDVSSAARGMVVGGVWMAGGFAVISLADGLGATAAIGVLLLGTLAHVVGEMVGSGGQFGVQMGLAPHERQGQYQGFSSLGFSTASAIGPTLVTLLCIEWGRPGWFVMGGVVLAAAVLTVPVSGWALRTREQYGAATASG